MKIRLVPPAAPLVADRVLAAGSTLPSGSEQSSGSDALTVLIRKESVSDTDLQRFEKGFEPQHKGTVLDIQVQAWCGGHWSDMVPAAPTSRDFPDATQVGPADGKQRGVRWCAADRNVICPEDRLTRAGTASPPRTRDEWLLGFFPAPGETQGTAWATFDGGSVATIPAASARQKWQTKWSTRSPGRSGRGIRPGP